MTYVNTFIRIAEDCPTASGVVPASNRQLKPIHLLQYELLTGAPYTYTHDELLFEVNRRRDEVPEEQGEAYREQLLAKKHPCLRASMLPKKYGWGVHYNEQGKIAIYAAGTPDYQAWLTDSQTTVLPAMRNSRPGKSSSAAE
ncbi:hypothetical protein DUZ99_15835 [Xylanibacillus composti]|uniref:Uncharacterized protein n=1 Tax=Xylanibacillus composti TaxID=1572762 RepID=A0A8J4H5U6_9BACL|nr:DUF6157 family protein [Xylanibacillus composti]MDT9726453.1 hypothetical protein [Xylanibacillus composti]GIQ71384.1 hypothetical protein XYCOK13_42080 [Xylanibacillus composti]